MTAIPEPLTSCRAPLLFSPSQLAFGEECLLRAVLGSTRDVPMLSANPIAILGSVFHKLLELSVRGEVPREGTAAEDLQRALDRLLEEQDARLASVWPGDPPKLRQLMAPLAWRRKRRDVLDLAEKYLNESTPRSRGTGRAERNPSALPTNGRWAELPIEAPAIRLRGKVDLLERIGGKVVIRDLKTGRVTTDEGDVLPHIERQMRLYGLIAHALWPAAEVALIVDRGTQREIDFTAKDEADVLMWLDAILSRVPVDSDIEPSAIASPGDACHGCVYRHACLAYRAAAPENWSRESRVRMPLDTWGTALSIHPRSDGLVDLTLRDVADRMVKVFGLAAFRVSDVRIGDAVWLFGLRSRDKRGGPELWRHPHNFFEVSDDDPFARAWTVESFVEPIAP